MRNFLHTSGEYSSREQRLLGVEFRVGDGVSTEGSEHPRNEAEIRETTSPEEVLQKFMQQLENLKHRTDDRANRERQCVVDTAQREIDTVLKIPSAARDFVTKYLIQTNKSLYPQGLQMRWNFDKQRVTIDSYAPTEFAPEVIARKHRIEELKKRISEVNKAIEIVMKGFRQDAVNYRFRKRSAMNRRNYSPEISRMLMQSSMDSMRDTLPSLEELRDARRQLTLELARATSAPLSDFRTPATPPEYGPHGSGPGWCPPGTVPYGAPRGGMPTPAKGAPEEIETPKPDGEIFSLIKEWKEATTKEEKDTKEGLLMMNGVDVEKMNLEKFNAATDTVTMAPEKERTALAIQGLIKFVVSFIERLGNKRTKVDAVAISSKDPTKMDDKEKTEERTNNTKKITELTAKKETATKELTALNAKSADPKIPSGEKVKLEEQITKKKAEITAYEAQIKNLEKRNGVLDKPESFVDPEKEIVKGEKLNGDENYVEFERSKSATKANIRAQLPGLLKSPAGREGLQRSGLFLGIDLSKIDTEIETITAQIIAVTNSIVDSVSLERNSEGQYRMRMDFGKIYETMQNKFDPNAKNQNELSDAVKLKFTELMTKRGPFVSMDGMTAVTGFMSEDDLNSNPSFFGKLKNGAIAPETLPPPAAATPVPPRAGELPPALPTPAGRAETLPAPLPAPVAPTETRPAARTEPREISWEEKVRLESERREKVFNANLTKAGSDQLIAKLDEVSNTLEELLKKDDLDTAKKLFSLMKEFMDLESTFMPEELKDGKNNLATFPLFDTKLSLWTREIYAPELLAGTTLDDIRRWYGSDTTRALAVIENVKKELMEVGKKAGAETLPAPVNVTPVPPRARKAEVVPSPSPATPQPVQAMPPALENAGAARESDRQYLERMVREEEVAPGLKPYYGTTRTSESEKRYRTEVHEPMLQEWRNRLDREEGLQNDQYEAFARRAATERAENARVMRDIEEANQRGRDSDVEYQKKVLRDAEIAKQQEQSDRKAMNDLARSRYPEAFRNDGNTN